jgi:hydrogenase maturation protease
VTREDWTVVGVGDRWRHDDGVGIAVAGRLGAHVATGEPVALLELLDGAGGAIVVDAARSGTAAPGTVHRIDVSRTALPEPLTRGSTHLLGLGEAIELARALGRLPPRAVVYAVEATDFSVGVGLSPPVAAVVDAVAQAVRVEVDA